MEIVKGLTQPDNCCVKIEIGDFTDGLTRIASASIIRMSDQPGSERKVFVTSRTSLGYLTDTVFASCLSCPDRTPDCDYRAWRQAAEPGMTIGEAVTLKTI